ncbi:NAD(P)H-dependent oxidoreductase [Fulvivirgaceae bacterium BMA12]|uniref:NAD(P)H-dependent oxidoreductase n=1 Tax=Agaribacillus aureus TaxID=3051825 RepID=A0ABT8L0Z8_9BACT|nr:NAD(P)H-dependent oxidoreductase [Fulvivirgaceae bacterium BMA12]
MKTLVLVFHPNIGQSKINKRWIQELSKYPEKFLVHELYKVYPDEIINVSKEKDLIESHDKIVFQFPFYWFNCPPMLKKWLDEVLTYGWAYGSNSGYMVSGKKITLAISAGIDEEEYSPTGKYKYTIKQLTAPFELTFEYVKADYRPQFVYYGMEFKSSADWIEKSVPMYINFLDSI